MEKNKLEFKKERKKEILIGVCTGETKMSQTWSLRSLSSRLGKEPNSKPDHYSSARNTLIEVNRLFWPIS